MTELVTLISVLIVLGMTLPAAYRQYQTDREGFFKTLKVAGLYLIYCFVGIGLLLLMLSGPPSELKISWGMTFFLSWLLYGVLWLIRLVPRYRELPAWIDKRNSALDYLLWAAIGVSLAVSLLG